MPTAGIGSCQLYSSRKHARQALGIQMHRIGVRRGASPSPQLPADQMRAAKLEFENQTLREIVGADWSDDIDAAWRKLLGDIESFVAAQ